MNFNGLTQIINQTLAFYKLLNKPFGNNVRPTWGQNQYNNLNVTSQPTNHSLPQQYLAKIKDFLNTTI